MRISRFTSALVVAATTLFLVGAAGCAAMGTSDGVGLTTPSPVATPRPAATPAPGDDEDLTTLYARVIPAVVSIRVIRPEEDLASSSAPQDGEQYTQGQGSGFVVDAEERVVVTNNHVVEEAKVVEVVLQDGTILRAQLLGGDPDSDVAALRVEGDAPLGGQLVLGDSDALSVGQRAIAIGNPFGWQGTMTVGIISGLGRTLSLGHTAEDAGGARFSIPQMIQTDAAINYGNSGGPLLDGQGRVIGINTAMTSVTGVSGGVGFAIPINAVRRVLPSLIAEGSYAYPWLGISGTDLQPVHVEAMNLPVERGALVTEVVEDGPAARAGLRGSNGEVDYYGATASVGGDVIVGINGQAVLQFDDVLTYLVENTAPGDRVELTYVRDGTERTVEVTLGRRPEQ